MVLVWILLAVVISALLAVVLYQWLRLQRLRRRASVMDIAAWVGTLLRSFAHGSVLVAEPNGKDGFIQFALTQRRKEWRTLEFGLPETDWSRAAILGIQEVFDSAGVSWTLEDAAPGQPVRRFLRAKLTGERMEVLQRAKLLVPRIAAAMGHPDHQTYRIQLLGQEAPEYRQELTDTLKDRRKIDG